MLRFLLTLLAANFLVFMWLRGAFDSYLTGARDPDRLNQQVDAERLKVASTLRNPVAPKIPAPEQKPALPGPEAGSPSATTSAPNPNPNPETPPLALNPNLLACSELGPLDESMLERARKFFADYAAYFVSEVEPVDEAPSFLVYSVPAEDLAQAQRKLADFKRQGFEGIAVISEGPRRFGMSFGSVRTEALAKAMVESLTRRGVRSLRVAPRDPNAAKSVFRFRYQAGEQGLPTDVSKELQQLGADLALAPAACATKTAGRPATKP